MTDIIYIPGFNESPNTFENLQWFLGKKVSQVSLPWHPWENREIPFSMTATREWVEGILQERINLSWVITTSLSVWPLVEALSSTKNTVKKTLLLNPAYRPCDSVVRMYNANPLIQRRKPSQKQVKDFLWENLEIFLDFLWWGKISGDTHTFQRDLQRFHNMWFAQENEFFSRLEWLRESWVQTKILCNKDDAIIFGKNQEWCVEIPRIFSNSSYWYFIDLTLGSRESKSISQRDYSSHVPAFTDENAKMIQSFFGDN